jgi:pyochelin synthetase
VEITTKLARSIRELCPDAALISLGGATEAAIWSIYHIIKDHDCEKDKIPYGTALSNQGVSVLNDGLDECGIGEKNEIYISGKGLALGYLNLENETEYRL